MSLYGSNVEYGLHCLLHLVALPQGGPVSSRDLAIYQGVSPSLVAKLFTRLRKAGLVESSDGIHGGFRLAHAPGEISVLDVVRALEGGKPLFQCREIRRNCILYGDALPASATRGVCAIHAVMLEAEQRMLETLRGHTLASLARTVEHKTTAKYAAVKRHWFGTRHAERQTPARLRSNTPRTPKRRSS